MIYLKRSKKYRKKASKHFNEWWNLMLTETDKAKYHLNYYYRYLEFATAYYEQAIKMHTLRKAK